MAQEYINDDIFATENPDIQELDNQLGISTIADEEDIVLATDQDKKKANETQKSNQKPEAQSQKKPVKKSESEEEDEKVQVFDEMEEETVPEIKSDKNSNTEKTEEAELSEMGAIAEGLFKAGIWTRDEDEDETYFPDTQEEFAERFDYESKKLANNYVSNVASRHGEEAKELFDAIFIKGTPVKEYVTKWQENQDFKSMDMTQEENQVRVVETMLKEQGIPDEKIREKIRKLKLSEDLEDEATTYHGILVKKQEKSLQDIEENSIKQQEQKKMFRQQFNSTVDNIISEKLKSQEFDGVPVNSKSAEVAKDILKTQKWKLPDGTLATDWDRIQMDLNNPNNYETKIKLALLFKPYTPGKPLELNLQAISKKAVSAEATRMFNVGGIPKKKSPVPDKKEKEQVDLSDLYN